MDRPRVIHLLRTAASTVCLLMCGLLVLLWARSYWSLDEVFVRPHVPAEQATFQILEVFSWKGLLWLHSDQQRLRNVETTPANFYWRYKAHNVEKLDFDILHMSMPREFFGFCVDFDARNKFYQLLVPYWCLALASGTLAAVPWIRFRFSLRTLLIAVTLVAIGIVAISGLLRWVGLAI